MPADVVLVKRGRIGYVTIDCPERRNCISMETAFALADIWDELRDDPDVLVAILTGSGDVSFCAGGDLKEAAVRASEGEPVLTAAQHQRWHYAQYLAASFPKPVIAAVNGYAAGGGMGLALACDVRLCSDNAQFGASEVRWSHLALDIAHHVSRTLPLGWAMWLCLSGQFIDAATAHTIGLVQGVHPQGELMERATELAEAIAANGDACVLNTKEFILRSLDMPFSTARDMEGVYYRQVAQNPNYDEGTKSFIEKRKPQYDIDR